MGLSPMQPVIQLITIDTMLNNNGLNIGDRVNFVMSLCERSLRIKQHSYYCATIYISNLFLSDNKHHDSGRVDEDVGVQGRNAKDGDAETYTDAVHHRPHEDRSCQGHLSFFVNFVGSLSLNFATLLRSESKNLSRTERQKTQRFGERASI